MKKIIYLLMSLSLVAFASCSDDDKENASSNGGSSGHAGTENGHEWVDLGLTSGTRWATMNVGATKPEEFGNYYAWGETSTKSYYYWSNYKYANGDYSKLTKYNSTDSKTTLDLSDDAAYVNWGGKWRMPTKEQQDELSIQCYWVWTESYNNSNVNGYIVYKAKSSSDKGKRIYNGGTPSSSYSMSDAHIFLPAAGCRSDGDYAGSGGLYWSSSLRTDAPGHAWYVNFGSDGVYYSGYSGGYGHGDCYYGQSVRAVIPGE